MALDKIYDLHSGRHGERAKEFTQADVDAVFDQLRDPDQAVRLQPGYGNSARPVLFAWNPGPPKSGVITPTNWSKAPAKIAGEEILRKLQLNGR